MSQPANASSGFVFDGELKGHTGEVLAVAVSPNGGSDQVATAAEDGAMVWSGASRTKICRLGGFGEDDEVTSIVFCPGDENLLFSAAGKVVRFHDLRNPDNPVEQLELNKDDINQLAVHEKGTYLAAADDTGSIKIIDVALRKSYKALSRQHDNICSSAQFRPGRQWDLVSGGLDANVVHWDFSRAKKIQSVSCNDGRDLEQDDGQTSTQMCNPPLVHSLAISGDGNSLAAGCGDCTVAVYSLGGRRGQMAQRLRLASGGHSASVGTVHFPVFAPTSCVLSGGNDRRICLWDVTPAAAAAAAPLATQTHSEKINWITSAPAGRIYVADTSATVKAFRVEE